MFSDLKKPSSANGVGSRLSSRARDEMDVVASHEFETHVSAGLPPVMDSVRSVAETAFRAAYTERLGVSPVSD